MTLRTTAAQSRVADFHFFTSQDDISWFMYMARELVTTDGWLEANEPKLTDVFGLNHVTDAVFFFAVK